MSIYSIMGDALDKAYSYDGDALNNAYDINGNEVYNSSQAIPDYTNYSYVQQWASKGIGNTQGFDIYDDKVFWVSKSGNGSIPANCYVFNLNDGSQALDDAYITVNSGHGNNLCFDFPKLYATSAYTPHVYINTMTDDFVATLEKTLFINDGCKDCDACIDENDNTILWTLGHNANDNNSNPLPYILSKWDLSDLTDNGDGTYTPKNISTITVTRPPCYYFQGCKFHDSMLWFASGYSATHAYVYGVNVNTGEIVYTIDCETNEEIEGIAFYPDENTASGYAMYVGFYGMMLRKYTFDSK